MSDKGHKWELSHQHDSWSLVITADFDHLFLSISRFGLLYIPPWAFEHGTWLNYLKFSFILKDSDDVSWMSFLGVEAWYFYGED